MNSNTTSTGSDDVNEPGPRKLNKLLIGLGLVAFGLVVTDRVMEAFRAGDLPDETVVSESLLKGVAGDNATDETLANANGDTQAGAVLVDKQDAPLDSMPMSEGEALVTLENLFGSPVVLVSAAEPSYVVTQNETRFDVGSVVDNSTTLAGVTSHQLIFEQAGDLLVISLPDPVAP